MHEDQPPDASRGQVGGDGAAYPTHTRHKHRRLAQPLLSR